MRDPVAYLAGPLGFTEAGRLFHTSVLVPLVKEAGFEIRDPWALTDPALIASATHLPYGPERKEAWERVNPIIGANNAKAIEECDVIVAVLDGCDVDSGTASEIGYGTALGRTTIGYRGDFRLAGDNAGSIVNLQVEYFIYLNDGKIVHDIEHLRAALTKHRHHFQREH